MGDFLQELKRRNVFRVGFAYLIVSWLIVQVVETVSDPLALPEWTEAFFIVLLAVGFPLAVIFAWAFELTPEGIKKTHEVEREKSVTATTGKKLNNAIIVALVLALAYFIFERQFLHDHGDDADDAVAATEQASGTSIAVLPFVNMSADQEQEYFSDGISEELLNLLAKVPELRVAARTSSFQFKDRNLDIGKVAEQLNVKHVLEGSVRKADTRVRITAQLIEADTGYHLWSGTYDRELVDVFGIQDEISAAIVGALSQTLGLAAADAPQLSAAANAEAYNEYLLGQHLINKRTKSDIENSVTHFQNAIELDPDYAPAHASLALASLLLMRSGSTYGDFTLDEALSVAEPAIERALQLDPELADAHAIYGLVVEKKYRYEAAITHYEQALRLNPSLTDVRNWLAITLGKVGRSEEAFEVQQTAYEIDPLSGLSLNNYLNSLRQRRRTDEMEPIIERLEPLDPSRAAGFRAWILTMEGQHADATIELFRGADLDRDQTRIHAAAAFTLERFDLLDEARRIWPFPNAEGELWDLDDPERVLELAREKPAQEPDDPESMQQLAWANVLAGNFGEANKWAERYLDRLDEAHRSRDFINGVFAYDAWQRGDADAVERYLAPLDRRLATEFEAGLDTGHQHLRVATHEFMRGNEDKAAASMEKALSREMIGRAELEFEYRFLGMNRHPRLTAIKADYDNLMAEERRKLLAYACGEVGFKSWKPLERTCKEVEKSTPVPL